MRIGIFGGSFDPIHQGHLILAEWCREQGELDEVWFLPCATNPLKSDGPVATDRQRCEMLDLALAGHLPFRLSRLDLERGGTSYAIQTLQTMHQAQPDDEWFWLMGTDTANEFGRWKQPADVLELATPMVVERPGAPPFDAAMFEPFADKDRLAEIAESRVTCPLIEISSTNIRQRVAEQRTIRYLTPRSVEKYIETQQLYHSPAE